MARIQKYVAAAALAAVLVGTPSVSYAVSQGETAHGTQAQGTQAYGRQAQGTQAYGTQAHAKKVVKPRIVQPGEHVVAAPGFELWLTEEGKYWTTPDDPEPRFRSVVDGNIDRSRPGVSLQAQSTAEGDYYLSGVYYGGKGTASYVEVETAAGTVRGKLIELPGKPGWGAWYAITTVPAATGGDPDSFLRSVTVYDTKGRVYSQLPL